MALPSGSPAACNVSQHPSKLSMRISGEAREAMQRSPSPDVELGFAEDVAARGAFFSTTYFHCIAFHLLNIPISVCVTE